jgi:hypothetical protein
MEKEETLEEAAEKYSMELLEAKTIQPHEQSWIKAMFVWVAKWQAKRMYSEEDLREAWENGWEKGRNGETKMTSSHPKWFEQIMLRNRTFTKWFEQFKKK